MEMTVDQALQEGILALKEGRALDADRYFTAILANQPQHPAANHYLGVLAMKLDRSEIALPYLKVALEQDPSVYEYWNAYIELLIKLNKFEDARFTIDKARSMGVSSAHLSRFELMIAPVGTKKPKNKARKNNNKYPPAQELNKLIALFDTGKLKKTLGHVALLLKKYPHSSILHNIQGAAHARLGNLELAVNCYRQALKKAPNDHKILNNLGLALKDKGNMDAAIKAFRTAINLSPNFAEAHNNMGLVLKTLGKLNEAIGAYKKAIEAKPQFPEALNNIGNVYVESGDVNRGISAYKAAIATNPNYAEAFLNLSGTAENIAEARNWIEECLKVDANNVDATISLSAVKFYQGDKSEFTALVKSSLKEHPSTRSLIWAFNLPKLPPLYFHRWALFDQMMKLSKTDRPFYEFGVWRGEAFKYLIKTFKKGYGFDTFEGLPEDWHDEKSGTYSSDGNIPKVDGGEFIVGKFEDTLPSFFAEKRPMASIINFDADLYSSTICALNFAKPVIDQHTILIFDEFIMNKNWEEDEYKALEEFCLKNKFTYEVLAISFFTKQVAVRLVGV